MRVQYIGRSRELRLRQYVFERGKWAEVRDADFARELLTRPDFRGAKAGRPRKVSDGDES